MGGPDFRMVEWGDTQGQVFGDKHIDLKVGLAKKKSEAKFSIHCQVMQRHYILEQGADLTQDPTLSFPNPQ